MKSHHVCIIEVFYFEYYIDKTSLSMYKLIFTYVHIYHHIYYHNYQIITPTSNGFETTSCCPLNVIYNLISTNNNGDI